MTSLTFKQQAAQGDLLIRRINDLPQGLKPMATEHGRYIVAHSETGYHHVIDAKQNVTVYTGDDPMVSYLQVIEATDATEALLQHLRDFHTHQPISIPAGTYELRRQREHAPEGWRMVVD